MSTPPQEPGPERVPVVYDPNTGEAIVPAVRPGERRGSSPSTPTTGRPAGPAPASDRPAAPAGQPPRVEYSTYGFDAEPPPPARGWFATAAVLLFAFTAWFGLPTSGLTASGSIGNVLAGPASLLIAVAGAIALRARWLLVLQIIAPPVLALAMFLFTNPSDLASESTRPGWGLVLPAIVVIGFAWIANGLGLLAMWDKRHPNRILLGAAAFAWGAGALLWIFTGFAREIQPAGITALAVAGYLVLLTVAAVLAGIRTRNTRYAAAGAGLVAAALMIGASLAHHGGVPWVFWFPLLPACVLTVIAGLRIKERETYGSINTAG